jgi:hypothetical protein
LTQREFKQIQINKEKLYKVRQDYKELKCISLVKGQEITDMPRASGCSDRVADHVIKIGDLRKKIEELESLNDKLIKRADKLIKRIPDVTIRQVLEYRFIVGLDDFEIHTLLGLHRKDINRIINTYFLDSVL